MSVVRAAAQRAVATGVGVGPLRKALLRRAVRRGTGLALLFHRVGTTGPQPHEAVPTVPTELFRRQLLAVAEVFDVVPLADLAVVSDRPRVALTFDDDYGCHVREALPALSELRLPATFFLSGRWLHGLGRYWWEVLEDEVAAEGLPAVAARYGVDARTPGRLAALLTGTDAAAELAAVGDRSAGDLLDGGGARRLVEAGMEIGFHTVHHPAVTLLDDASVDRAVTAGRTELAAETGHELGQLAYPHGRADVRTAAHVARAGYDQAWTTSKRATAPPDHPHLRSRWEPGVRSPQALVAGIASRLVRGPGP